MRSFLSRNIKVVAPLGVIGAIVVGYLAIAVFGVHTLFIDDRVDEAGPVFASGASLDDGTPGTADSADKPDATDGDDPVATVPPAEATDSGAAPEPVDADPATETTTTTTAAPDIITLVAGTFIDRDHPSSGVASVLTDGSEQRFLRFEDFETDNGPDLNVYLSTGSADGPNGEFDDDFIDLGDLKGNIGNQNYEIPPDVDLDRYTSVVIWCVRFGVAFGAADLV